MHKRTHFSADDPAWDVLESQWIAQMAGSDELARTAAMNSMFLAYNRLVRERLKRARIPPHDVNDIAQQLWVDLAGAARIYPGDIEVRVFVFRYFRYGRSRYFSRRKAAQNMDSLSDEAIEAFAERALGALAMSAADAHQSLAFAQCVHRALDAFDRVYPRLTGLLVSHHMEGRSIGEIAEALSGRASAIKSQLVYARKKFGPRVERCLALWPGWEPRK